MGKHKKNSKKEHKKSKKDKSKKKSKHYSSNSDSSSEDDWVEKSSPTSEISVEKRKKDITIDSSKERSVEQARDSWMSLPTSFLTSSNSERRREREEEKRKERERQQYNPRECPRELNPYWKDGGDGLPKFKKPTDDDGRSSSDHQYKTSNWRRNNTYYNRPKSSNWRKNTSYSKNDRREFGESYRRSSPPEPRRRSRTPEARRRPSPPEPRRRSRTPEVRRRSRSPESRRRSRTPEVRRRSRSPESRRRFRTPEARRRSRSAESRRRSRSPEARRKSRTPEFRRGSRSPEARRRSQESSRHSRTAGRSTTPESSRRSRTPETRRIPKSPDKRNINHSPESTVTSKEELDDTPTPVLSDKELNMLAAKLVKAEIMGNTKMINELKTKLENARKVRQNQPKPEEGDDSDVILTQTDNRGQVRPVRLQSDYVETGSKRKKQKVETHKDGERLRYFADDDKYSLKQMFENEKMNSVSDHNAEFLKMANKVRKNDDLDDIFTDNIRQKESDSKIDSRNKDKAVNEHRKMAQSLDNCRRCIQSEVMAKNLMISMNETFYLALPGHEPLTEGHCLLVPVRHVPCATQLDENEWTDLMDFRKALTRMFLAMNQDVIFFESAMGLHRLPHMYLECIPLPKEEGDMAPIYFRKAIDESETEWAQNKKLISMKGKDVRRAVPKGLSYFSVSFGLEEGFAHVIEDEQRFPSNFAQEIIGGMLDLHHSKWRRPKHQNFDDQSKRVVEFTQKWQPYDCCTNNFN